MSRPSSQPRLVGLYATVGIPTVGGFALSGDGFLNLSAPAFRRDYVRLRHKSAIPLLRGPGVDKLGSISAAVMERTVLDLADRVRVNLA